MACQCRCECIAQEHQFEHFQSSLPMFSIPTFFYLLYTVFWILLLKMGLIRVCPSGLWKKTSISSLSSGPCKCAPLLVLDPSKLYRVPSCVGACLENPWSESSEQTRAEFPVCLCSRKAISSDLAELDLSLYSSGS